MDKHETILALMKMPQSQKLEVAGKLMRTQSGIELAKVIVTNIVHEWEAGICERPASTGG